MKQRKSAPILTTLVALLVVAAAVALGWRLVRGDNSLLRNVSLSAPRITPNADGDTDAVLIQYELSRNAVVSITFQDADGQMYLFRDERVRGAGEYSVYFSGVVAGYTLPDEVAQGQILTRLLRDGVYTWRIAATDMRGQVETQTGSLEIADADTALPEMRAFELDRALFTPNQDGIDDRVQIQFVLQKQADVRVFLQTAEGGEIPIGELERNVPAGMPGRHVYDYEGGVDNGETPPPDGTYLIVGLAQDAEGQQMRVEQPLTIRYGGVPRADIVAPPVGHQLQFNATAVALCDTLYFTLTVENYGTTPIRTTGPDSGTVYDSEWNYNTLGWFTESGAWRVAIGYENQLSDYPYRWAVGGTDALETIDGYPYLMPGQRAVVTGGIRMTGPLGQRNPQPMWAGLIHEDVEISEFNNRVDTQAILIDLPDPEHREPCAPRDVPHKVEPAATIP
ncbi:MAG: hypothetical protein KC418_13590 [Anaerolineales bacterium]|nr:hypothetical protein [Anaerolineales bacterium]MCB8950948.1 hypothetical protein [Ardenticatenales bacterium]